MRLEMGGTSRFVHDLGYLANALRSQCLLADQLVLHLPTFLGRLTCRWNCSSAPFCKPQVVRADIPVTAAMSQAAQGKTPPKLGRTRSLRILLTKRSSITRATNRD